MKTRPDSKPRLENFIRALLLILVFHITPFNCRPPSHGQSTHHPSFSNNRTSSHHSIHSTDLRTMAKFGELKKTRQITPSDSPIDSSAVFLSRFNYNTYPIDVDSNDSHLSRLGDDYVSVGGSTIVDSNSIILAKPKGTIHGDVPSDVTDHDGTTHGDEIDDGSEVVERIFDTTDHLVQADMNEVEPSIDELSRIPKRRRQRSSPNQDHRWRKRHRLLLKTRESKDHLTGRRRDRFLLKSDGPGHVIFKAGEVKKDWCRTIRFDQNVTSGRCSKVVRNNLCYGQCNSFFIPQSEKGSSKVAFQSCSFCKPHRLRWVNVTLDCPPGRPKVVQKTILKVEACRCIAADAKEMDRNVDFLRKDAKNIRVNQ